MEVLVKTCPECGATSDQTVDSMFSGVESAIRDHDDLIECMKCGYQGRELAHTIHIRHLNHVAYERLWNLRKFYKVGSWAKLIDKITEEYVEQIMEYDWI